jgi:uncharacterized protein (TIGR00725 family)
MAPVQTPLISVVGGSDCGSELAHLAEEAGKLLAEAGVGVVCGGGGGVMQAVCKGAYEAGGVTIGILPGVDNRAANPYVRIAIPTGIGEARNAIVVRAGAAILAIGGGYGTLSEIAFGLKWGKQVIGLRTWQATNGSGQPAAIHSYSSALEAVAEIVRIIQALERQGG